MTDNDALESALQKIAAIDLSDAEINALAEAISAAADDDVAGFAMAGPAQKGWNDVLSFSFGARDLGGLTHKAGFSVEREMKESGE